MTAQAGQPASAPGLVKVRICGAAADVEAVALMLRAAASLEVLDQSAPYANRRDPGVRAYVTARLMIPKEGRS